MKKEDQKFAKAYEAVKQEMQIIRKNNKLSGKNNSDPFSGTGGQK